MARINWNVLVLPLIFVAAALVLCALMIYNYLHDGRLAFTSVLFLLFALFFAFYSYSYAKRRYGGK